MNMRSMQNRKQEGTGTYRVLVVLPLVAVVIAACGSLTPKDLCEQRILETCEWSARCHPSDAGTTTDAGTPPTASDGGTLSACQTQHAALLAQCAQVTEETLCPAQLEFDPNEANQCISQVRNTACAPLLRMPYSCTRPCKDPAADTGM